MPHQLIRGRNFSGRSEMLRALLMAQRQGGAFFVGPYAEAALSGLSNSVADEIEIYRAADGSGRTIFDPTGISVFATRKPATLSGGEQVLLALHCFSNSDYRTIGIDTALEQLDPQNRAAALTYLSTTGFDVAVIDNRIDALAGFSTHDADGDSQFTLDIGDVATEMPPPHAPTIDIKGLDFAYRGGPAIFRAVDLSLVPGTAYRIVGANGAGKSTLLKLLVGVLAAQHGWLALDGLPYHPVRSGNRAFALASQNPDHQWCGATLREDIDRRRRAFRQARSFPTDDALTALAAKLGASSFDQPLYDLPLAARKRVSWLWPFCGAMPWIMLDEPSVGQDAATRDAVAAVLSGMCGRGYGIMFVTHDGEFAGRITHRRLRISGRTIVAE